MAKGKSTPASSSTTAQSKKNAQKTAKTKQNQEKLIDISSEDGNSTSDTENLTKNVSTRLAAGNGPPNKCSRTTNAKDMNEDFAASPSSPSASSLTSENSSITNVNTTAQPQSGVVPPNSADQSFLDQVNQPRFPVAV